MSVTRSQTEKRVDENQNLSVLFDVEFDEKKYENFYIGNIYLVYMINFGLLVQL